MENEARFLEEVALNLAWEELVTLFVFLYTDNTDKAQDLPGVTKQVDRAGV